MRRLCIFSFYDPEGRVDDYVIYFLKELGKFVEKIVIYSNGPLLPASEQALRKVASEVIVRPNVGFDVLAYKAGLEKIGFDSAAAYDEVLMVNHTCFGPIYPFAELFGEMEKRSCDFWGVTAHMEVTPNPFTERGRLPFHLNANFIAVRAKLLRSSQFRKYWKSIQGRATYEEAILEHEAIFTEHFSKLGYVCDTYLDCRKYGTDYPAFLDVDETLADRNPLLKRRIFFQESSHLEHYAVDLPRALRIIERTSDYDTSMIWRNVVRAAELRTLNTNAALTSIFPDVRIKQSSNAADFCRVAVCAHVYYTDMVEELLELSDTIPCAYDFIATTETQAKKEIIENMARGRKNVANVIVRVVEQNRGRDMSSLFITCRDLFLDDRYDAVCRLHTKKTPHLATGRSNVFKRHMFENLLNSPGYTANVLDMFRDKPWVGVAIPSIIQMSYGTLGHAWGVNRHRTEAVAELLDIKVPFDKDTPVGTFGGMFWFRPTALRKLFVHPWKWTDFESEPYPLDGSLGHALERLITYVAQDAQFTTEQILSSHLANWNFGMLEYKLQKLSSAIPNADFLAQANLLDSLRSAERRANGKVLALPNPPSMREAFRGLAAAGKRSLVHRAPRITRYLSRIYRGFLGPTGEQRD